MEEIKIGTIIELNDEAKVIAEKFVEDDQINQYMMQYAARLSKETRDNFWKSLIKIYPELKGYRSMFSHKDFTITVVSKE